MNAAIAAVLLAAPLLAGAQSLSPQQRLARDIYKELIEINTVTATGDTAKAAEAMAARLRSAGFAPADVQVFSPASRKGNLVARMRGSGAKKPIMLLAHIDVVEAKPEDWSTDPFKLVEKDGYYYGRGTGDDKYMAATWVANMIRYKKEGYKPDRDLILVLETDEELSDARGYGITWLLKNHKDLLDAEVLRGDGDDRARPARLRHEVARQREARSRRDRPTLGAAALQRADPHDVRRDAARGRPCRQRAATARARDGQLPDLPGRARRGRAEDARDGARRSQARRRACAARHRQ